MMEKVQHAPTTYWYRKFINLTKLVNDLSKHVQPGEVYHDCVMTFRSIELLRQEGESQRRIVHKILVERGVPLSRLSRVTNRICAPKPKGGAR